MSALRPGKSPLNLYRDDLREALGRSGKTLAAKRRIAEKNRPIMAAITEALEKGDTAEFMRHFRTLNISADVALHIKRAYGADRIRKIGMRTDRAEALLGPGWLDE